MRSLRLNACALLAFECPSNRKVPCDRTKFPRPGMVNPPFPPLPDPSVTTNGISITGTPTRKNGEKPANRRKHATESFSDSESPLGAFMPRPAPDDLTSAHANSKMNKCVHVLVTRRALPRFGCRCAVLAPLLEVGHKKDGKQTIISRSPRLNKQPERSIVYAYLERVPWGQRSLYGNANLPCLYLRKPLKINDLRRDGRFEKSLIFCQ